MFASPGLASCRRRPLSSNGRPHLLRFWVAFFLVFAASPVFATGEDVSCVLEDHRAISQCLTKQLIAAEESLEAIYQATLSKLPESDPMDIRKGRPQLVKAQEAWKAYVKEQCDLVGGLTGGNNFWVSEFSRDCAIDETRKRLQFFRNFPSGG